MSQRPDDSNIRLPGFPSGVCDVKPFKTLYIRQITPIVINSRLEFSPYTAAPDYNHPRHGPAHVNKTRTGIRRDEVSMVKRHIIIKIQ